MIEIGFKKIELEDKDLITHYFSIIPAEAASVHL